MLRVFFGEMPESIYNTSVRFDNSYESSWIEDALAKEIIKDIDKSEVINGECIRSNVLGVISPTMLSGGTKTLLLIINEPSEVFNASTCGDNCVKWLFKIAESRDVTINVRHFMRFGKERFDIEIANIGRVVHSMEELLPYASEYLNQMHTAVEEEDERFVSDNS